MSQSIKLNDNNFVDAEGVYDSTLGKTQRELNGNGPVKLYYSSGVISDFAPGSSRQIEINLPQSYREIIGIIPFGASPQTSWAGLAYITAVYCNTYIECQVPSFVTVTDNYCVRYAIMYR